MSKAEGSGRGPYRTSLRGLPRKCGLCHGGGMVWSKDRWSPNEQILLTNGLVVSEAEVMAGAGCGGATAFIEHDCPECDGSGWEYG
jgi:hypothetical protein